MPLLFAFLTAFALTVVLVPLVGRLARSRGVYAVPQRDRWHRQPVPNVGGIAMLVPILAVVLISGQAERLAPVLLASVLMFAVGLSDDLRTYRPSTKLLLQMLAAGVLLALLPTPRITGAAMLDLILSFAWIVGITNAMNLLDNIDGLAAGVAGIAGAFFLAVLYLDGGAATGPLALAMAGFVGATAGFLLFNFHPASIFMGDGGSHLLGSFLAGATLMSAPGMSSHLASVAAIPIVLLLIPIFDTAFVTLARGLSGQSAFLGGRDHTSHRLVALGIGERRAVLVLYVLTGLGGLVALGLMTLPAGPAWGLVALYVSLLGVVGIYLGQVQVTRDPLPYASPLPSEVTNRYRAYEVLVDALLLCAAYYLAFVARFRAEEFERFLPYFTRSIPFVVGIQLVALWLSGKYRQVWGTVGPSEMARLVRASLLGVAASVVAMVYLERFDGYSRFVFLFDAILAPVFIVSARSALSGLDQYLRLRRSRGRTALIYGAGRSGTITMREMLQNPSLGLTPLGFIDDDPKKRRLRIEGLAVVGTVEDLGRLLDRRPGAVSAVIIAISDLSRDRLDRVVAMCTERGIAIRRLRLDLEEVRSQQAASIVRFPGA